MRSAASGTASVARVLAHLLEPRGIGEEPADVLDEPRRREHRLRQDDGAADSLDHPRVLGLLVAAGARQGNVEGGHAELAALVHRSGARAGQDEGGRGVDAGELGADVGHDRVAARQGRRQRRAPLLEPRGDRPSSGCLRTDG